MRLIERLQKAHQLGKNQKYRNSEEATLAAATNIANEHSESDTAQAYSRAHSLSASKPQLPIPNNPLERLAYRIGYFFTNKDEWIGKTSY